MIKFLKRAVVGAFLLARVAVPGVVDWASRDTVPYRHRPKPATETMVSYVDVVVEHADRHRVTCWFVMDIGPRLTEVRFTYRDADESLDLDQTGLDLEPFYETFLVDAKDAYQARIDMSATMN